MDIAEELKRQIDATKKADRDRAVYKLAAKLVATSYGTVGVDGVPVTSFAALRRSVAVEAFAMAEAFEDYVDEWFKR